MIHQLRHRLNNIKKGTKSLQAYIDEVNSLSDSLAGDLVTDEDVVYYILQGLPSTYDSLTNSIRVRSAPITIPELAALLFDEELNLSFKSKVQL